MNRFVFSKYSSIAEIGAGIAGFFASASSSEEIAKYYELPIGYCSAVGAVAGFCIAYTSAFWISKGLEKIIFKKTKIKNKA